MQDTQQVAAHHVLSYTAQHQNPCRMSMVRSLSLPGPAYSYYDSNGPKPTYLGAFQEGQCAVPQEVEVVVIAERDCIQRT